MAKAYLIVRGRKYPLDSSLTLIGREQTCHIQVNDPLVSGRHAFIVRDGDSYELFDFKSSNGVRLNGETVIQAKLSHGQVVEVGGTKLTFEKAEHRRPGLPEPPVAPVPEDPVSPGVDTLIPPGRGAHAGTPRIVRSGEEILRQSFEKDIHTLLRERVQQEDVVSKLLILYKVSSIVNTMMETDVLLGQIVHLALEVMSADRGFIMLLGEGGELETKVRRVKEHEKEHEKEGDILPISRSIALHCFKTCEAILTNDALVDERFQTSGSIQMYNIRSAMCVPLKYRDEKRGVLYVDNRMSSNSFNASDFLLLKAFADQVAVAIENSMLLTNLKASLQKIQAQQDMLVQSEKMAAMGHLAAGLAHEIRNPLTAISGYLQMYFRKYKDEADFYHQMRVIEKAVLQIQHVLEGLLGFARKGPRQLAKGSLNQVLEDTVVLSRPAMVRHPGVQIVKRLEPDIPGVMMDQRQLQQVFLNFVLNAAQAMPRGGTLTIATRKVHAQGASPGAPPSHVVVVFEDTGVGIPADKQAQIFQPFYTSGKPDGTGLGLTISKSIIEGHRGTISFESVEGKGTSFILTLPVEQA
ncbi:MAG: GAF domain-containing protein [Candidatus Riflebacteria bacterium]|nr:GAF domain-containing protein [Candidatus Riflebacteria bacterium]